MTAEKYYKEACPTCGHRIKKKPLKFCMYGGGEDPTENTVVIYIVGEECEFKIHDKLADQFWFHCSEIHMKWNDLVDYNLEVTIR